MDYLNGLRRRELLPEGMSSEYDAGRRVRRKRPGSPEFWSASPYVVVFIAFVSLRVQILFPDFFKEMTEKNLKRK